MIAVSAGMRDDILRSYPDVDPARVHVVHNGIDTERLGADRRPRRRCARSASTPTGPAVIFVGRITRQKGLPLPPPRGRASCRPTCSSCCAPARPTPRRSWPRSSGSSAELQAERDGVVWIDEMLPQPERGGAADRGHRVRLPVDLRAAGHRQPRGDGLRDRRRRAPRPAASPRSSSTARPAGWCRSSRRTDGTGTPLDPERYVADLAAALVDAVSDPARARERGLAGRRRAQQSFSWPAIAAQTLEIYRSLSLSPQLAERGLPVAHIAPRGEFRSPPARQKLPCRRR